MASISYQQMLVVKDLLGQIHDAIVQLQEWNQQISSVDDYLVSAEGTKTLAASCMLIEAIGEGVKKIDGRTSGNLLINRPEIPWQQVMGMRNHIAHGYFDINAELVWDVIKNDLQPLLQAVDFFTENLYDFFTIEGD